MKPLNEKIKTPKKAVRVASKASVIKEDFITLGFSDAEIGTVSAIKADSAKPDFDALFIKKFADEREKCVYLRKSGEELRLFYAEKTEEGRLAFTPYALSEFSLNELLLGNDRRASDESVALADRLLGENDADYISRFMPEELAHKRKNGLSVALSDDGEQEYTAFYWKKGKSVPCADCEFIPELFEALETLVFNKAVMASPEQIAEEITREDGEEAQIETENENISEEEATAEAEPEQTEPEENKQIFSVCDEAPEEENPNSGQEKKPEKESFFKRMRRKKQLKEEAQEQEQTQTQRQTEFPGNSEKSQDKEEAEEDEISAEESEELAAALNIDLFSEQELDDIFENAFEDEAAAEEKTSLSEQDEAKKPAELSSEEEEYKEKANAIAEEAQIIEEETSIIESEEEELKEEAEELKQEKLEIIEHEHSEMPAVSEKEEKKAKKKKFSLFSKKPKKKKVSQADYGEESKEQNGKSPEPSPEALTQEKAIPENEPLPDNEALSESEPVSEGTETAPKEFSIEEFFESEKPISLLQILEAADINNDNKDTFLPYMKPALMNTVFAVPINDSGKNTNALYVSKKAAQLLENCEFKTGENRELIMPDDDRIDLRLGIKLKTIMFSGEAYIPVFTDFKMFEQIFGKLERAGLFAFPNLCKQIRNNEHIKGIIINPEITDLILSEDEITN